MNITEETASILKALNHHRSFNHKSLHQTFKDSLERSSFLHGGDGGDDSDLETKGNFMNIVEYVRILTLNSIPL